MKTHVKALVVGGGAVGCGIAYHLAKAGWDTMLVERDELTAGSTWHAAGLLPLFIGSGAGSEIMQRIAAPMVGGMITAPLLSMLVIPAAYRLLLGRALRRTTRYTSTTSPTGAAT